MKYRTIKSEFYCGVDVHPKRSYICIMDNTGKTLLNRNIEAGKQSVVVNETDLGNGIYYCRLTTNNAQSVRSFIITK